MSIILGDDEPAGTRLPADEPPARLPEQPVHMWDLEGRYPWGMALLYALAILAGLLGNHVVAWIVTLFGGAA